LPEFDDNHQQVGFVTDPTNVVCIAPKWDDALLYQQATVGNYIGRWIPADQVHVTSNPYEPNPVPGRKDLSGCFKAATVGTVALGVASGALWWRKRRGAQWA
jgi:hypothetical protein